MKIPPTNSRTRECVLSNDGLKIKAKLDQFHHYEIAKLIIEALGQSQLTVNVLVRMFVDDAIETINKLEERKIELVSPDKATDEHHPLSQVVRDFYERVKAQVISLERKLIIASSLEGKATKYKVIDLATAKKFITELENFSDEAALRQVTSKTQNKDEFKELILQVIQDNPGITQNKIYAKLDTHFSNIHYRRCLLEMVRSGLIVRHSPEKKGSENSASFACYLSKTYLDSKLACKQIDDPQYQELIEKHVSLQPKPSESTSDKALTLFWKKTTANEQDATVKKSRYVAPVGPRAMKRKKEDEKNQSASKRQRHSFSDNFQSPDNPLSNLQNFHILTRSQKRKQAAQTIEIKNTMAFS